MEKSKQFLQMVVSALVDYPQDIKIESTSDEMGVLLILYVAKEDIGKIIGKEGNTAKAIRTLLRIVGLKEKARVNLRIPSPNGFIKKEKYPRNSQNDYPIEGF